MKKQTQITQVIIYLNKDRSATRVIKPDVTLFDLNWKGLVEALEPVNFGYELS
jgi:hypothetical protein